MLVGVIRAAAVDLFLLVVVVIVRVVVYVRHRLPRGAFLAQLGPEAARSDGVRDVVAVKGRR